jgi:hypothetical protein
MTASSSNIRSLRLPRAAASSAVHHGAPGMLSGSLAVVSPVDLLEWLCSNRKMWTLRLRCHAGEGEVVVVQGELTDARWGNLRGMEALSIIVGCHSGFFELVPVSGGAERTLDEPWQSLLLRAVQMLDERNRDSRRVRTEEPVARTLLLSEIVRTSEHPVARRSSFEPSAAPSDSPSDSAAPTAVIEETTVRSVFASADELIDRGFSALRAGDSREARRCWSEALAMVPDNRTLRFNLRKLDRGSRAPSAR